jgi:citronellol/citronellal dehydrogenase
MTAGEVSFEQREMGTPEVARHFERVAIITGASRGIGKAVALRLAAEGARICVAAKSEEGSDRLPGSIHDTVREIEALGGEAIAVKVDVRDEEQVADMVAKTIAAFGKLDILFNNAGAIHIGSVLDTPLKRFDLMWQVNVRATLLASQLAIPHMRANGWGHVLTFSPEIQTGPSTGMAPYMTTKYGMTRIAMAIAEEHRADNIAGNAIWPVTMIETAAVINNQMGDRSQWRTPRIVCDAVSELFSRDPQSCTGRCLTDEEILRETGVSDFDDYWSLGHAPDNPVLIAGPDSIMH